jgi:hypothetical protein
VLIAVVVALALTLGRDDEAQPAPAQESTSNGSETSSEEETGDPEETADPEETGDPAGTGGGDVSGAVCDILYNWNPLATESSEGGSMLSLYEQLEEVAEGEMKEDLALAAESMRKTAASLDDSDSIRFPTDEEMEAMERVGLWISEQATRC